MWWQTAVRDTAVLIRYCMATGWRLPAPNAAPVPVVDQNGRVWTT